MENKQFHTFTRQLEWKQYVEDKKAQQRREKDKVEKQNCSFKPKISTNTDYRKALYRNEKQIRIPKGYETNNIPIYPSSVPGSSSVVRARNGTISEVDDNRMKSNKHGQRRNASSSRNIIRNTGNNSTTGEKRTIPSTCSSPSSSTYQPSGIPFYALPTQSYESHIASEGGGPGSKSSTKTNHPSPPSSLIFTAPSLSPSSSFLHQRSFTAPSTSLSPRMNHVSLSSTPPLQRISNPLLQSTNDAVVQTENIINVGIKLADQLLDQLNSIEKQQYKYYRLLTEPQSHNPNHRSTVTVLSSSSSSPASMKERKTTTPASNTNANLRTDSFLLSNDNNNNLLTVEYNNYYNQQQQIMMNEIDHELQYNATNTILSPSASAETSSTTIMTNVPTNVADTNTDSDTHSSTNLGTNTLQQPVLSISTPFSSSVAATPPFNFSPSYRISDGVLLSPLQSPVFRSPGLIPVITNTDTLSSTTERLSDNSNNNFISSVSASNDALETIVHESTHRILQDLERLRTLSERTQRMISRTTPLFTQTVAISTEKSIDGTIGSPSMEPLPLSFTVSELSSASSSSTDNVHRPPKNHNSSE